jgi:hypothetical protein
MESSLTRGRRVPEILGQCVILDFVTVSDPADDAHHQNHHVCNIS